MGALPGQRAAQRPMRAAVAAQQAIGRAVNDAGGMTGRLVMNINGLWVQQTVDGDGRERLVPYEFEETI